MQTADRTRDGNSPARKHFRAEDSSQTPRGARCRRRSGGALEWVGRTRPQAARSQTKRRFFAGHPRFCGAATPPPRILSAWSAFIPPEGSNGQKPERGAKYEVVTKGTVTIP